VVDNVGTDVGKVVGDDVGSGVVDDVGVVVCGCVDDKLDGLVEVINEGPKDG